MKVILERDYTYAGTRDSWHVFKSKPKKDFDPEEVLVTRARYLLNNGKSIFFDPIKK